MDPRVSCARTGREDKKAMRQSDPAALILLLVVVKSIVAVSSVGYLTGSCGETFSCQRNLSPSPRIVKRNHPGVATIQALPTGPRLQDRVAASFRCGPRRRPLCTGTDVAPHSFRRRWNGDLAPLMGPTPALAELMCSVEETARNAGYSVIFSNSKQTSATPATRCE